MEQSEQPLSSTAMRHPIRHYTGRGTTAGHVAVGTLQTQVDIVEIKAGRGFGGDFRRAQLWTILRGEGRVSRGEAGTPTALSAGQSMRFPREDRHLCVARTDVTLMIVESDHLDADGPWVEGGDTWQDMLRQQAC
jgi:quercetin dioxygenase-like cupin family protein